MAAPAYHLRTNKAIDRLLFVDLLQTLSRLSSVDINEYSYFGLGGPYMEDIKLVHDVFPKMPMSSLEKCSKVYKRQKFHKPTSNVKLLNTDLSSFIADYNEQGKGIFWLDYTSLELSSFEDLVTLLSRVASDSIVRITLQCHPSNLRNKSYHPKDEDGNFLNDKEEEFRRKFSNYLPISHEEIPRKPILLAKLLQDMIRTASHQTELGDDVFVPLSSTYYKDGAGIFTFTGMLCSKPKYQLVKQGLTNWKHRSLNWQKHPVHIDVPILSTKERLHIQPHLPCDGRTLSRSLGYNLGGAQMKQYAEFYREYPFFIRSAP